MSATLAKKIKQVLYRFAELPAKRLFHSGKPDLTPLQENILLQLQNAGIAFTSVEELFGATELSVIEKEYASFYENNVVQQMKETTSAGITNANPEYKNYNIRFSSLSTVYTHQSALIQKGLNPALGNIAVAYFNEPAILRYADYWLTIPVPSSERNYSQNWHRDPEDQRILKVFIYLNDVTKTNGAFEYIRGSHLHGPYNSVFPYDKDNRNNYPDERELSRQIPTEAFTVNEGKKGTIILCDTHGFHRGGFCETGERKMMTFMYNRGSLLISSQFKVDTRSRLTGAQQKFYAIFG